MSPNKEALERGGLLRKVREGVGGGGLQRSSGSGLNGQGVGGALELISSRWKWRANNGVTSKCGDSGP